LASIARSFRLPIKEFEKQYRDHLSGFLTWSERDHADKWLVFPANCGARLSIDEVALTNGELYTIVTNKAAHGRKGALVAIVEGTVADNVAAVISRIPADLRAQTIETTLDMSPAMEKIVRTSFPSSRLTTDRFHVQQLVSEAVQEIRVAARKEAITEENAAIKRAREEKKRYAPILYTNGDTKKQLLARSVYLLFKTDGKWGERQQERALILFREFPELKQAYDLSMSFRFVYENAASPQDARERFARWCVKAAASGIDSFLTPLETYQAHEETICN
jgi:transposase